MISEDISGAYAAASTSATAAGTGDNTAVTGVIVDRAAAALNSPQEIAVLFPFTTTLGAGKNLFLKSVLLEHGDAANLSDAATFATFEDATGHSVATSAGGGTVTGCKRYGVNIGGAKRYVRLKFTPDLDATSVDTAVVMSVLVFAKEQVGPAV